MFAAHGVLISYYKNIKYGSCSVSSIGLYIRPVSVTAAGNLRWSYARKKRRKYSFILNFYSLGLAYTLRLKIARIDVKAADGGF